MTHKKVMRSAGRVVFGPDGSVEFSAGPQWVVELFHDGDQAVLDDLCAALAR